MTDDERPAFTTVEIGSSDISSPTDAANEAKRLRTEAERVTSPDAQADAYANLGKFHARHGDIDAACEAFRLALHHNPHQPDALTHLFFLGRTA